MVLSGKHCPECGRDVGFRAVAFALVWIRCPRCQARLYHVQSHRMALSTALISLGSIVAALAVGVIVGWSWRTKGVAVALVGGIGVCTGLVLAFNALSQIASASVMRRTQRLARKTPHEMRSEEEIW